MAWFRAGGGGIPSSLKGDMNDVFNKKFGTVLQDYPPEDWPGTVNLMGPLPERTVSGAVVTFPDGADAVKLKSCAVTIAPTLDGVSSVGVVQTGKNFIDDNLSNIEQGTIEGDHGTNTASNTRVRNANYTPFPYDEIFSSYKLTIPAGWKLAIRFYKSDNTYVTLPSWAVGFVTNLPSDLVGQGVTKARFVFAKTDNSAITPEDVKNIGFQCEIGTTATAYEPYVTPTTHTANLGRTIYGGEVDVVNGTGTDDTRKVADLSTLSWTFSSTRGYFYTDDLKNVILSPSTTSETPDLEAENYTAVSFNNIYDGLTDYSIAINPASNKGRLFVRTDGTNTITPTGYLLYKLETPEDFTFTPVPILSRIGDNTMWGDVDLSVTYRRDIDLALAQ